ncbi:hypothetical protein J007_01180 [Cryptococcus neoformans]|nr:hypothetical protein J007_01180 [Cryptococcus neoformans var. grubii]OXC63898.1 hypothetical protein C358_01182 [Cryptococcus neoformans var. grubii MW-RSA852]
MSSVPDLTTGSYIPQHWRTGPASSTTTTGTSAPTISSLLADKFKHARDSTWDSLGGARNWVGNRMSNLGDYIKVPSPPSAEPVYGSSRVSFPSYLGSDDSITTASSSLGTQMATETATPSSAAPPSVAPTNAVSSSAPSRQMPTNATESTSAASSCNVTRTPEGCTSFDIDIRQMNLEEGVAIISTGDDGPAHSVIITRDINNVINIDVNRLTTDHTRSNSSTAPTAPRSILRRPQTGSGLTQDSQASLPTPSSVSQSHAEPSNGTPHSSLFDLASKSSLSYSGPLLVSGEPPTPGDDGQRVFQDVSVHDYCTSTNGLSGLDKPLTAFENMSSFIQRRYRQDDGSMIFSRKEANELAPYLLQSGNDGSEDSRALIGFGLDDLIVNRVLPSKNESEGDTSRPNTVVFIDDTEVPTTTEAGSGVDVSAWTGHSLNEWLSERVAPTDTFGSQSDMSSLADGKEMLSDVRSLGSQMCRRHGIDSDPDLTTYFSTRIGTYMTDRMLFSGKREVTPGILADADHILFKARSAVSGMSEDERMSTLLGRNAPTLSHYAGQSTASWTPSTEPVTSQHPGYSRYTDNSWWTPSAPTFQSSSSVESPLTSSTSSGVPSTGRSVRFNPYVEAVHYE